MSDNAKNTTATVIPTMRYNDATAAIAWLAEIVMEIEDAGHGGRGYSCRDPEGHLWNFGSYDPWAAA